MLGNSSRACFICLYWNSPVTYNGFIKSLPLVRSCDSENSRKDCVSKVICHEIYDSSDGGYSIRKITNSPQSRVEILSCFVWLSSTLMRCRHGSDGTLLS